MGTGRLGLPGSRRHADGSNPPGHDDHAGKNCPTARSQEFDAVDETSSSFGAFGQRDPASGCQREVSAAKAPGEERH